MIFRIALATLESFSQPPHEKRTVRQTCQSIVCRLVAAVFLRDLFIGDVLKLKDEISTDQR
jgi:hypothetical protein